MAFTTKRKGREQRQDNFSTNPNIMNNLYIFHDELGCGGFGKVKLATHMLTGERVAIKIIDKKAIGEDLPRVSTEIEALKTLAHQNICRMFQYVETEEKFFIVMEYCNGGEMFDYIVRKERLEESEARHFFRQLVQAIAYIHSVGFAHRDLKPENLLLQEDLQLKVIDFGLCAKPKNGLHRQLETCCGSPAYAAPELIRNSGYYGNEADVWSMGVLLYTLLCGSLPFTEDESMPKLYKKIMQGIYHEPSFLSTQSKELLRAMLTVNPRLRITVKELLTHPWLNKNYQQPIKWTTVYDKNVIDEDVARELSFYHSKNLAEMIALIKQWKFDYLTSTYLILLQKKSRRQNFALPMYRKLPENVVCSPTLHGSLDADLHLHVEDGGDYRHKNGGYEMNDENVNPLAEGKVKRLKKQCSADESMMNHADIIDIESPFEKSYAKAIDFGSPVFSHSPQHQHYYQHNICGHSTQQKDASVPSSSTPKSNVLSVRPHSVFVDKTASVNRRGTDAQQPCVATVRANRVTPDYYYYHHQQQRQLAAALQPQRDVVPTSVYTTPRRAPLVGATTALYRRPKSADREREPPFYPLVVAALPAHSTPTGSNPQSPAALISQQPTSYSANSSPVAAGENSGDAADRPGRSQLKTPRLRQRVFKSLERKADKMIHLLTPKKMRDGNGGPTKLKCIKTMVNVSVTSSRDPNTVRTELIRVLIDQGISPIQDGWKISGSKRTAIGGQMTVELEVVLIENLEYVGVKRRRLNGDAFLYKKVCEEVLRLAGL